MGTYLFRERKLTIYQIIENYSYYLCDMASNLLDMLQS
jgi:hypothetical protein